MVSDDRTGALGQLDEHVEWLDERRTSYLAPVVAPAAAGLETTDRATASDSNGPFPTSNR